MRQLWAEAAEVMSESCFADSATRRLSSFLQEGEKTLWTFFLIALFLTQRDLVAKKHLTWVISLSCKNFNTVFSSQWLVNAHPTRYLHDVTKKKHNCVSWRMFHFVSTGCSVVIASRKFDRLKAAAEELNNRFASMSPAKVTPIECNIRKEEEVKIGGLVLGLSISKAYCVYKFSDLQRSLAFSKVA